MVLFDLGLDNLTQLASSCENILFFQSRPTYTTAQIRKKNATGDRLEQSNHTLTSNSPWKVSAVLNHKQQCKARADTSTETTITMTTPLCSRSFLNSPSRFLTSVRSPCNRFVSSVTQQDANYVAAWFCVLFSCDCRAHICRVGYSNWIDWQFSGYNHRGNPVANLVIGQGRKPPI